MDRNRCFKCKKRIPVLSAVVSGTTVVLTIADRPIYNRATYCLDLGDVTLPSLSTPLRVVVKTATGTTTFNVLVKNGSFLYSDQLRRCKLLELKAASDTSLFMVENNCLPCTSFSFTPQLVNPVSTVSEVDYA